MANKGTVHVIRGELNWAKVIGEPRLNTYTNEKEWSLDLTPDAAGLKELKRLGIMNKLRDPKDNDARKERFLTLKVKETRPDKKTGGVVKNEPPKILDIQGQPWGGGLLGNGTIADVKFRFVDYGTTKGVYLQAIRVVKHVSYEVQEFAPISSDDEYFAEPQSGGDTPAPAVDEDMDDDIPF